MPPLVLSRRRLLQLGSAALLASAAGLGGATEARRPLRVALVSAAETYRSDEAFAKLGEALSRQYGMLCDLIRMNEKQDGFVDGDKLLQADTAIIHSRRKTLDERNLALWRKFVSSGKGFVALRSTSHGFENWPAFDQEILGARYGGRGKDGTWGNAQRLHFKPHPIWEGVQGVNTKRDIYRIVDVAPDVNVILEGENERGRVPVGWTREVKGRRLFYLALGYPEEIQHPGFVRAMANALFWVTHRSPRPPAAN